MERRSSRNRRAPADHRGYAQSSRAVDRSGQLDSGRPNTIIGKYAAARQSWTYVYARVRTTLKFVLGLTGRRLCSKRSLPSVPGRKAPGDPVPTFTMTVRGDGIAYIQFSGPREGEYLAADEVSFTPMNLDRK